MPEPDLERRLPDRGHRPRLHPPRPACGASSPRLTRPGSRSTSTRLATAPSAMRDAIQAACRRPRRHGPAPPPRPPAGRAPGRRRTIRALGATATFRPCGPRINRRWNELYGAVPAERRSTCTTVSFATTRARPCAAAATGRSAVPTRCGPRTSRSTASCRPGTAAAVTTHSCPSSGWISPRSVAYTSGSARINGRDNQACAVRAGLDADFAVVDAYLSRIDSHGHRQEQSRRHGIRGEQGWDFQEDSMKRLDGAPQRRRPRSRPARFGWRAAAGPPRARAEQWVLGQRVVAAPARFP